MSTPAAAGRGANVVPIPPPLYYAAAVAAGLMLQRAVPLDIPSRSTTAPVGVAALVAGLALNVGGVVAVARHHTTIVPHHSVATLVTTGAYRISRNPMYAGLALAAAGGTLLAGTWWPLLLMPAALLAVRRLAIDPEERYLTNRFGPTYTGYQTRVRRWL
jgi:protein-S-isoprenylcysteine O-methyltransferase Ste14